MKPKRQRGGAAGHVGQSALCGAKDDLFGVHGAGQHTGIERIAQPAGMGGQLVQRGRGAGFGLIQHHGAGHQRVTVGKGGDEFRNRRVQMEQAAFGQHHQGHRGDGFCHRVKPRHGIARERQTGLAVAQTGGVVEHDIAAPRDQQRIAGIFAIGNQPVHPGAYPRQPAGIKAPRLCIRHADHDALPVL